MAKITPQQAAAKWSRNLRASTESIKDGVNAVTVAPTAKAAMRIDAMRDGFNRAIDSGKVERGLRRVSLEDWKQAMLDRGITRIAQGATAGESKMEDFLAEWLPHMDALQRQLESTPRGDLQQNIQRAVQAIEFAARFQRRA